MALLPARKKDHDLLAEVESFRNDEENFHLWWLGQSGYLLTWRGRRILIDPYLSDSLTEKYAHTNKPHVRISERVVDPTLLVDIMAVSSSHNHTDHLDGGTLIPVFENNPAITFIIPEANRQFVSERVKMPPGFPVGCDAGQSVQVGEFKFTGVPASHNEIEKDEKGRCKFLGYIIEFGKWKMYHSGDTLWFDGMEHMLRPYTVDVAILPINGNDPARGVAGNLNCREAAELAYQIQAKMVIPCHYDMFTFNTADSADFEKEARKLNQHYIVLPLGGHFSSAVLALQ